MKEQIVININQLGAVRNAKIVLNQFMIFSGASGLGKSYTAMLVHFVYRILLGEELEDYIKIKKATLGDLGRFSDTDKHEVFTITSIDFLQWVNARAKEYLVQILSFENLNIDVDIEFKGLPETIRFYYNQTKSISSNKDLHGMLNIDGSDFGGTLFPVSIASQINISLFTGVLSSFLINKYEMRYLDSTFFMPPSRGAIMQIPFDKQFNVFSSTPMYQEYLEQFAKIRSYNPYIATKPITTKLIIDGNFDEQDGELIFNTNNVPIPISATASSIKEIAPFIMMAEKGIVRYYSILFEEPESHLHPELQSAVVDVMAQMIKQGAHFQITTHSDYILRRINDLIYLYLLKEKWGDKDKFSAFCEKYGLNENIAIDPSLINAYFFKAEEGGMSSVIEQDLANGVPFDTFETVIEKNFPISAEIYEQFEELR